MTCLQEHWSPVEQVSVSLVQQRSETQVHSVLQTVFAKVTFIATEIKLKTTMIGQTKKRAGMRGIFADSVHGQRLRNE